MTELSPKQAELCRQTRWDFTDLRALFINCTLKRSPELSHTQGLADISMEIMRRQGVTVDGIRAVDHDIATGVWPDMTEHGWGRDEWPEIFDPAFRDLDPQWPSGAEGRIPAMKEKLTFFRGAIPDFDFTVLKQLVVGDNVVCHWEGNGTHLGEFAGITPSGKPVRVEGISIFTCRQGKIVEQIITYDVLGMLQQMGATTIPT